MTSCWFQIFNREINKAFCGFFYQSKCQQYQKLFKGDGIHRAHLDQGAQDPDNIYWNKLLVGIIFSSLVSDFCYILYMFFHALWFGAVATCLFVSIVLCPSICLSNVTHWSRMPWDLRFSIHCIFCCFCHC